MTEICLRVSRYWCAQGWIYNFCFRGDNYITNNVRVVSLAWESLLGLLFIPTKYYQIISNSMGVMACPRVRHQGRYVRNGEGESTLEHDMPTGCLYQTLTKYFKPHTQKFGLEIHSEEQPQRRLDILHVTHLLVITNASTKHNQNMSKGIKVMGRTMFWLQGR